MAEIIIYTSNNCPYCINAKSLLERKNQEFHEINVADNQELRMEMMEKSGGARTVPQIFIDGKHIGGFDDMAALDQKGELDPLLGL